MVNDFCTKVTQFHGFFIAHGFNDTGSGNNARISSQHARHIGGFLHAIGLNRPGNQGRRIVATASTQCRCGAVWSLAYESFRHQYIEIQIILNTFYNR